MSTLTPARSALRRVYARSSADLGRWAPQGDRVFLDIETAGDGPKGGLARDARVVLISVYDRSSLMLCDTRVVDPRIVLSALDGMQVIGHNLKFDLYHLRRFGFRPARLYDTMLAEQLLHLGRDESARLEDTVPRYLRRELDKSLKTSFDSDGPFSAEQLDYAANDVLVLEPIYMEQRMRLKRAGLVRVAALEFDLVPVLVEMETNGMLLNVEGAEAELAALEAEAERSMTQVSELLTPIILEHRRASLEARDAERAYFKRRVEEHQAALEQQILLEDFESPMERRREIVRLMREFKKTLTKDGKLPPIYHMDSGPILMTSRDQVKLALNELLAPTGQYLENLQQETVRDVMNQVEEDEIAEVLRAYLDWKGLHKLITGTVRPLLALRDERDRVSTDFAQIVRTGRMSSSEPNLQNVPVRSERGKRIRRLFVAEPGSVIMSADYSQIELRVLAQDIYNKTGGRTLLDIFRRGNVDIHSSTAAMMYELPYEEIAPDEALHHGLRREAKTINFGLLYGMSKYGLARDLGCSVDDAEAKMELYFSKLPDVDEWARLVEREAREVGYAETMMGRKRYMTWPDHELELRERRRWEAHLRRVARNTPIQGTAADIMKLALVRLHRDLPPEARLLNVVHDEVVLELPERAVEGVSRTVNEAMVWAGGQILPDCPVTVDIGVGPTWS